MCQNSHNGRPASTGCDGGSRLCADSSRMVNNEEKGAVDDDRKAPDGAPEPMDEETAGAAAMHDAVASAGSEHGNGPADVTATAPIDAESAPAERPIPLLIDGSPVTEAPGPDQGPAAGPAPEPTGTETATPLLSTTCPVCGQTTPANRFCGFCGAPLTEARGRASGEHGDPLTRALGRVHDAVFPSTHPINTFWHRIVVPVAILVALIALLANDIGIALIATAVIAPTLLVLTLRQLDVFERESSLLAAVAALTGLIGGLVIGGIMSWAANRWWYSAGGFNHGAAGYGAEFAHAAGNAPFLLLLVNGILLPAIGVAAMLLGPIALRRFDQFRNEAMDGLLLGALGGAGYVTGTVIIFVAPEIGGAGPTLSVRHWTLLVLGLAIFRPLVVTAGAAVFGAGLWRYMMTERSTALIIPAAAGVGGIVLLYLGTMVLEPRSLVWEVGWNLLLTIVLAAALSLILRQSIAFDRRVIGGNNARVRCPSCGQVTPRGSYCANCGQPLPAVDATG